MLDTTFRQIMAIAAIVCGHSGQGGRFLAMELSVALRTFARGHWLVRTAGPAQDDVVMAFDAGDGHLRTACFGFVRRMAGGAGGQFVGAVAGKGVLLVELLGMTGLAQNVFALHQQIGVVAAMTIMAQQAFAHSQAGVRLADHLLMVFVAGVARLRLGFGQQRQVGAVVESAMTV